MKFETLKFPLIAVLLATPAMLPADVMAAAPPVAALAAADPCANLIRCFNAGNFTGEVLQLVSGNMQGQRHHIVKVTVRLRNITDKPLILGYHAGSSTATDNLGNTYYYGRANTHDTSAQGIGVVESQKADPQFQLAPGQSRNATFQVIRFDAARTEIGTGFNYDLTIDELAILNGNAIRTLRSNALSFAGLSANMPAAGMVTGTVTPDEVAQKMLDLFHKKKK